MTTLNIFLPDDLQEFVTRQLATGNYGTAGEYINHLIRQEQERLAAQQVETLLVDGLDSGESIEANETWWAQKRADLVERLQS